jgi:glycosyltransferase involved in cell wall biosynthesis
MKLLHVISGMDPALGGVSQAIRTMIKGLAIKGCYNEVANLDVSDAPWNQSASFVTHALGPGSGPWQYSPNLIPWLLDNLTRFDVVILHGLWLYNGYALRKALCHLIAQRSALGLYKGDLPKFYIMPHGMLDPYFQRATGRRLKAWRNWIYWHFIEAAIVNKANGLLFTCETERLLARASFTTYRPQREQVIGLGVEEPPPYITAMHATFLAKCPELHGRSYLLFLSRINEKKGVELLIRAYTQARRVIATTEDLIQSKPLLSKMGIIPRMSSFPALVIAGPGLETVYGQQMQHLAADLLASSDIFFPGMLTGDAKWGAFYGCEAFVLPSHQENFGIAVVEALACSKPVLISNQVNIWHEIEATGSGIVTDDTLAGTRQLLESWSKLTNQEKQEKGTRARALYHQHFAVLPAAEKLMDILKE